MTSRRGRRSERSETSISPSIPSSRRTRRTVRPPRENREYYYSYQPARNGNIRSGESDSDYRPSAAADSFKSTATHGSDATDVRRAERVFSLPPTPPPHPLYPETAVVAAQLGPRGACIVFRNEYYNIIIVYYTGCLSASFRCARNRCDVPKYICYVVVVVVVVVVTTYAVRTSSGFLFREIRFFEHRSQFAHGFQTLQISSRWHF